MDRRGVVLFADVVPTNIGGTPVIIPEHTRSYSYLGTRTLTLKISDDTNAPVTKDITIEIIDATARSFSLPLACRHCNRLDTCSQVIVFVTLDT